VKTTNGKILVVIPSRGHLVLKDARFLSGWHKETAVYPSGKIFTGEVSGLDQVQLRGLFSDDKQDIWFWIGTEGVSRIANTATPQFRLDGHLPLTICRLGTDVRGTLTPAS
jgi:hypothetical protein